MLKAGQQAARKGLPVKVPLAAKLLPAGYTGHTRIRDLVATVKHYLLHETCEVKYARTTQHNHLRLLLIVDTSASMAADQQICLVKGLIMDLLQRYRHRKPEATVIALSHGRAITIVPATNNVAGVNEALMALRTGGKTNLVAGWEQVRQILGSTPSDYQLYVFTDGRINAGTTTSPMEEAISYFKTHLKQLVKHTSIINTETGYPRLGMAVTLAERLGCRVFEPQF